MNPTLESSPYEPPEVSDLYVPPLTWRARLSLWLAAAPILALGVGLLVNGMLEIPGVLGLVLAVGVLVALVGFGLAAHTAWKIIALGGFGAAGTFTALGAGLLSLLTAPAGALAAFLATFGFTRGRQLRRHGKLVFAPLEPDRAGWLPAARPGASAPAEVADAWRHNGLTEHASVAAFGKVAAELIALGAPARLVEAAYADALDEHRHTSLCFGLARDLDGRDLAPGPFPAAAALGARRGPRALRLANLAVESLVDGALNEGVSARVVAGLAKQATEPRARAVLAEIARDEARHAAHGFDVVRWCLAEGGAPVAAALEAAVSALPATPGPMPYDLPDAEAWGLPRPGRVAAEYAVVRARLRARVARLFAGPARKAC